MLDRVVIQENKDRFIKALRKITRPGADIEGLINRLDGGGFFEAPYTTDSFRSYAGGLCEQALCRYVELFSLKDRFDSVGITMDSAIIVGLLADVGKMGYFERNIRNKKVYSPNGKKVDEIGNFDWVAEEGYKVKDPKERFIFGSLCQNSERIITDHIPLTIDESAAIIHLHADYENPNLNLASIYLTYPLAVFANCADKIASFIDTREDSLPF